MKFLVLLSCIISMTSFSKEQINGAGASFPYPIYTKWFAEYEKTNTDVQFNYQAIGSGGGTRQVIAQTVDFGASDVPLKEKDIKKAPYEIKQIPTVLGAVSVIYNVAEIATDLKLDGQTLADIFQGKVSKWNDEKIAKLNPNQTLPEKDILVVRRADSSGTTGVFTDYLSTASNDWKSDIGKGKVVSWPTGIGAKGSRGVTNMVQQTDGAIGYVELSYALTNKLKVVALKNHAGEFVTPSVEGVTLSAAKVSNVNDVTKSIVNAQGKGVYPISSFTYVLLPVNSSNPKLKSVHKFLQWALTDGQKMAKSLHYAPLPKSLADKLLETIK